MTATPDEHLVVLAHGLWGGPSSVAQLSAAIHEAHGHDLRLLLHSSEANFTYLVGRALGLDAPETKLVMILMACPTAIVSYTVALEMKGDEPIASGAIVLSVLLSLVSLAVILAVA